MKKAKKELDISKKADIIIYAFWRSGMIGDLCNGSTPDSDSVCGGSNPSSPATEVFKIQVLKTSFLLLNPWKHCVCGHKTAKINLRNFARFYTKKQLSGEFEKIFPTKFPTKSVL